MIFGTKAWLDAVVVALNRQPGLAAAVAGLASDAAVIVERDAGFPRTATAYGRMVGGRVEARLLPDEDEVLELEPGYVVRAPYRLWKDLLLGRLDPVKAATSGRVKVQGDLEALVRRVQHRVVIDAALREVATSFPDEEGSR